GGGGSAGTIGIQEFIGIKPASRGGPRASTTAPISGTPDPFLYQTERYSTNGELHFAFDSGSGEYLVILHFAEIYWTQVGQRVFDVSLEGRKVLSNYDIVKQVGPLTATMESFVVPVTDGVLNLDFRVPYGNGGVDQAKISAIELFKRSTSGPAAASSSARVAAAATAPTLRDLRVYPNPSTGRFTLTCTVPQAQTATLTLNDQRGRTVQKQTVQLEAGNNHVVSEVPGLEPGLYLLSLWPAEGPPQRQKLLICP
ncbi:MAG: T9SS type A sorting domain-containing protein, partial [Hymenobacter sp.]